MASIPVQSLSVRATPQTDPIPGSGQRANSAGGYSWELDDWQRLDRFLILGCDGGTYYVQAQDLLKANYESVSRCLQADGLRVVRRLTDISESGRAAKNEAAIFVLALSLAQGDPGTRKAAATALPRVCRTGTHLLHFAAYADALRGWGRGLRRALSDWYLNQSPDDLAYQVVKYRQRDGWSQADVLRRAHPRTASPAHQAVLRWVAAGSNELGLRAVTRKTGAGPQTRNYDGTPRLPALIHACDAAKRSTAEGEIVRLIGEHRLPREAIPTQWLNSRRVWAALLAQMPLTALIRNLAKLTVLGVLAPGSDDARRVTELLRDPAQLKRARIHPFGVLLALRTYQQGHGDKGALRWTPVPEIAEALDEAFYASFTQVRPAGKPLLLALDVSWSMVGATLHGSSLTAREASAAMALVTAATEPGATVMAFSDGFVSLDIKPGMRLDEVVRRISNLPFDGTDCALPMNWARQNAKSFGGFVIYTDSETWAGDIHPAQALRNYRRQVRADARCVVVGMTSEGFTIADPADRGMLDVVGFDAAAPAFIADFLRAEAHCEPVGGD